MLGTKKGIEGLRVGLHVRFRHAPLSRVWSTLRVAQGYSPDPRLADFIFRET